MFYVYRLNKIDPTAQLLTPSEKRRNSPDFALQAFLKLIKDIGWDGSWTGKIYQFALPAPKALECVAIQEATLGRWFIGAPVPLSYLDTLVDFDARTDSQEVKRVIADMQGGVPWGQPKPLRLGKGWGYNGKGTLTARINGMNVCVLPAHAAQGYVGIIFGHAEGKKVTTPVMQTEGAAQQYLWDNFHKLTREWNYDSDEPDDDDQEIILSPRF